MSRRPAVAVVGMACRYPGAADPAELWRTVLAGRRAFRRIPPERLRLEDHAGDGADSLYVREAALVDGWELDRAAYRVSGSAFRAADPAHWLALDTAARALADAGFPAGRGLPRVATGVIVGNSLTGEVSRAQQLRLRWPYVERTLAAALDAEGWPAPRRDAFLARLEERYKAPFPPPGEETLAGGLANTIAGRVANHFDLGGGGFTVDGACSSSLLAVAQAASALAAGELDAAVVGGVDLSLDPFELVGFSRAGAFARGRMRIFDRRSAGFLPGEGCGFVVLVPLAEARRQGLRVRAVLRGWGVSSDGAGGLTRPEPEGQLRALARAYRGAGFGPDAVAYFEAHGTGTAVGDAAELLALDRARREAGAAGAPPAAVGSIKALIGHTKAAAGIAGLIKAALAVEAGVLPATVGCEEPQALVAGEGGADGEPPVLRVLARAEPWPAGAPRRAGVSSFGFGGINAHVVLEAAPGRRRRRRTLAAEERRLDASRQDAELLVATAGSAPELVARLREIAARAAGLSHAELGDLAAELAEVAARMGGGLEARMAARPARRGGGLQGSWVRRASAGDGEDRVSIAADERSRLDTFVDQGHPLARTLHHARAAATDRGEKCGLFAGFASDGNREASSGGRQDAQAVEAGPSPSTESRAPRPEVTWRAAVVADSPSRAAERMVALADRLELGDRRILDPAAGLFAGASEAPPRIGLLFPGQGAAARRGAGEWGRRFVEVDALYRRSPLPPGDPAATEVAQPALALAALAGLTLLRRLGIAAGEGVAVGHSVGELAALHAAGRLGAGDLLRLAAARGRAMGAAAAAGEGGMTAVSAPAERVAPLLAGLPVVVAGANAPRQTVVAGPLDGLAEVERQAAEDGLRASRLAVAHAFHSPAMAAAAPALEAALAAVRWVPPPSGAPRVVSTVTGRPLAAGDDPAALLLRQLTAPVRFRQALAAAAERVDLWIEVGPGRVLCDLAARNGVGPAVALDVGGRLAGLLAAAGAAWTLGAPVAPRELFRDRFTLPLPAGHRFFANPCETAPLAGRTVAGVERGDASGGSAGSHRQEESPFPAHAEANGPARGEVEGDPEGGDASPFAVVPSASSALSAAPADPLAVVRGLVARRAELPADAVEERLRLLSDLHLNSITVGQLVVEAARALGAPPPASPTDYADATVGEVAAALAGRVAAPAEDPGERHPPGVDAWVRGFERVLVERERPEPRAGGALAGPFRVLHLAGDRVGAALAAAAGIGQPGEGPSPLLVALPPSLDRPAFDLLAAAARAGFEERAARVVLVHRGVGAGFFRTLHLERGAGEVVVVELPADEPSPDALPALAAAALAEARAAVGPRGYAEVVLDRAGRRRVPVLRPLAPPAGGAGPLPLGPSDVLLVTGGGRGIAAEAAFRLARASGAALALVGRSRPAESAELAANLERFAAAGLRVVYRAADVADAAAVARAVAAAEAELGAVTALLHGAGVNRPRPVTALAAGDLAAGWAVKVDGLAHALAAVDVRRLRLLVAFGSVIAEAGLPGEADYALANEGLARAVERFAAAHPGCRCRTLEWSVWSGVGMGERLGTLESLLARGITPIPPDRGLAALEDLLARADVPPTVVVAGRLGDPPTLDLARPELPFLRFLERERVHVPGVELVVDCELAAGSDPYLDEHVFAGERLFPAVLGLEAMAQAAAAVAGRGSGGRPPVFEAVRFARPVAVPAGETVTLRLAALVREDGRVEVALRSSTSGFAVDCFRAVCRFEAAPRSVPQPAVAPTSAALLPLDPAADLYGGVLFHQGRFRRLAGFRRLTAIECVADVAADGMRPWFGRHLPGALLLGDAGARDAAIHAIQACIPHATVLPAGVDRLVPGVLAAGEAHLVEARERSRDGRDLVYDLEVRDAAGWTVERWEGLRLRAVEERPAPPRWPAALLGPYLERRLGDLLPAAAARVALGRAEAAGSSARLGEGSTRGGADPPAAGAVSASRPAGRAAGSASPAKGARSACADPSTNGVSGAAGPARWAALHRRPDGRPDPTPDGRASTRSRGAGLEVEVVAAGAAGCDLEAVAPRSPEDWRGLLGASRLRLAELLATETGEELAAAATRVWAAGEAAKKAGLPVDAPLVLDACDGNGWVRLAAGSARVATFVGRLAVPAGDPGGPPVATVAGERDASATVPFAFAFAGCAEAPAGLVVPPVARAAVEPDAGRVA